MEHDLRPFTDELPGDVVPLDQAHPRNPKEGYSSMQLHWLGSLPALPLDPANLLLIAIVATATIGLCCLSPQCRGELVPLSLLAASVGAMGLAATRVVLWHRAPPVDVPWTGTLGRFRVQRGSKRLILIDPLWTRRWGPTYSTLMLPFASVSLRSGEFPGSESVPAGSESYRGNAGHLSRRLIEPDTVAAAFNFQIRNGCIHSIKGRRIDLPLERIIALEVAGTNATIWFRDGDGELSKLRVWRHGIAFAQALLAEPAFFACAPLRFNDNDARNFDWIQQYKPEPVVAT